MEDVKSGTQSRNLNKKITAYDLALQACSACYYLPGQEWCAPSLQGSPTSLITQENALQTCVRDNKIAIVFSEDFLR